MKVFTDIFRNRSWGGETPSGPGSGVEQAKIVGGYLVDVVTRYGIKSVLDAPCGDFNWMRYVPLTVPYYGVDLIEEMIADHRAIYEFHSKRSFEVADITKDHLPRVDLVFSRDCLMHLSLEQAMLALENFKKTGARFLLTTSFRSVRGNTNHPIRTGQWQPINLELSPFNMADPIEWFEDWHPNPAYPDKSLGLWRL